MDSFFSIARSLPMDVPLPSPSDNGLCDSTGKWLII